MGMPINQVFNSASPGFTTGGQIPVCLDFTQTPFNARVGVDIPAGSTANYSVEFCMDDVNDSAVSSKWYPDPTLGPGQTTSATTTYTAPVQFVRVNIASLSGSLALKCLQGLPT